MGSEDGGGLSRATTQKETGRRGYPKEADTVKSASIEGEISERLKRRRRWDRDVV